MSQMLKRGAYLARIGAAYGTTKCCLGGIVKERSSYFYKQQDRNSLYRNGYFYKQPQQVQQAKPQNGNSYFYKQPQQVQQAKPQKGNSYFYKQQVEPFNKAALMKKVVNYAWLVGRRIIFKLRTDPLWFAKNFIAVLSLYWTIQSTYMWITGAEEKNKKELQMERQMDRAQLQEHGNKLQSVQDKHEDFANWKVGIEKEVAELREKVTPNALAQVHGNKLQSVQDKPEDFANWKVGIEQEMAELREKVTANALAQVHGNKLQSVQDKPEDFANWKVGIEQEMAELREKVTSTQCSSKGPNSTCIQLPLDLCASLRSG